MPENSGFKSTTPHPRTIRKARETVKAMVTYGFSTQSIKTYLFRWCVWWTKTNVNWSYQQLLLWFIQTTHFGSLQLIAKRLLNERCKKLQYITVGTDNGLPAPGPL